MTNLLNSERKIVEFDFKKMIKEFRIQEKLNLKAQDKVY